MKTTRIALFIALGLGGLTLMSPGTGLADLTPCYVDGHEYALPGDVNGDCRRNLVDVTWIIRHIFVPPQDIIEVSCNRQIDATDLAMLLDFCFGNGPDLAGCQ
jgi:hypothetical protein